MTAAAALVAGESQEGSSTPPPAAVVGDGEAVVVNDPLQISEQDDREYRHITLPNKMQVSGIFHQQQAKPAATNVLTAFIVVLLLLVRSAMLSLPKGRVVWST